MSEQTYNLFATALHEIVHAEGSAQDKLDKLWEEMRKRDSAGDLEELASWLEITPQ